MNCSISIHFITSPVKTGPRSAPLKNMHQAHSQPAFLFWFYSKFIRRTVPDRPHRHFTSPRVSASRPHCVLPLVRGCGWTEVSLSLRMCHRQNTASIRYA